MNVKKVSAAVAAVVVAGVAVAAANSQSYVQAGLVAQWDAEDNVGRGQHSNAVTTWVNLADTTKYALSWVNKNGGRVCWAGRAACFTRVEGMPGAGYFIAGSDISGLDADMGSEWTIEVAATPETGYFSDHSGLCGASKQGGRLPYLGQYESGNLVFRTYDQTAGEHGFMNLPATDVPLGRLCTFAFGDSPTTMYVRTNGVVWAEGTNGSENNSTISGFGPKYGQLMVGAAAELAERVFSGRIHSVRIYSHKLTAEEAAANAAVDRARFVERELEVSGDPACYGGVTPAYGVHSACYAGEEISFFAPQDAVVVYRSAAMISNATVTGWTVYTNAAASAEWLVLDSGETAEGRITMPDVPVRLVWHWSVEGEAVEEEALPPYAEVGAYPQQGLYALWDAIDNCRSGSETSHSGTTTVWSDLVGSHDLVCTGATPPTWSDDAYVSTKDVVQCMFCDDPAFFTSLGDTWTIQAYVTPGEKWFTDNTAICGCHAVDGSAGLFFGQWGNNSVNCTIYSGNAERTALRMKYQAVYDRNDRLGRPLLLTMTASPVSCRLYLNERLVQEVPTTRSGDTALNAAGFYVGNSFAAFNEKYIFEGKIHSVRVYSRTLTSAEVGTSYAVDRNRFAERGVLDYEFLEWIRPTEAEAINAKFRARQGTSVEAEFTAPDDPVVPGASPPVFGVSFSALGYLLNFTDGKIRFHTGSDYRDVPEGVWQAGGYVRFRASNLGFDVNGLWTPLNDTTGDYQNDMSIFNVGGYKGAAVKLRHLRFFDKDDVPIRDFYPARQLSTGALGLYDAVGDKFYGTSSGIGFDAGPALAGDGKVHFGVCPMFVRQTTAGFLVVPLAVGATTVKVKAVLSHAGQRETKEVSRFAASNKAPVMAYLTGLQPDADYTVTFVDDEGTAVWPVDGSAIAFKTQPTDVWSASYQPLEYIETTERECIDTLVQPTETLVVDVDAALTVSKYPATQAGAVFGADWSASGFFMAYSDGWIRFHSCKLSADVAPSATTWQPEERIRLVGAYAGFGVNDVWTSLSSSGSNTRNNLILFSTQTEDLAQSLHRGLVKLYCCTISNALGGIIRDYQPVRRRSDGILGLYDRVNGDFYRTCCLQTGWFVAGPKLRRQGLQLFVR